MSTRVPVERAKFTPKTGANQKPFLVHFNPVSLQFSVSNTVKGRGARREEESSTTTQGSGKLTMDLIFDTRPMAMMFARRHRRLQH